MAPNVARFKALLKPEIKIGKRVQKFFRLLEKNQELSETDLKKLCSATNSKIIFDSNYPILIPFKKEENGMINGYRRYYTEPFTFNDKQFLLVNHWMKEHEIPFKKWQQTILPIA